ncbi:MAG TPA: hypothetical protein VEC99_15130 [Clostridia bacterium]|nr:hypothetical protein [Clostridia bacterium]
MDKSEEIKLVSNQIAITRRLSHYTKTGECPWSPEPPKPPAQDAGAGEGD